MRAYTFAALTLLLLASDLRAGTFHLLSQLGSVGGGDRVLLRFDPDIVLVNPACDPAPACIPRVSFGGVPVRSIQAVDGNTLEVITPAHAKGIVDVVVTTGSGTITVPAAFTFDGWGGKVARSNYQAVLFPILLGSSGGPLPGIGGSAWLSEAWIRNGSTDFVELFVNGYPSCLLLCSPCCNGLNRFPSIAAGTMQPLSADDAPGGVLYYVQRGGSDALTFSLRVRDASRGTENLGTEIPVVPEAQFGAAFDLLNVPVESGSRTALRVYGMTGQASSVTLRIFSMADGQKIDERPLVLQAGNNDSYDLLNDLPKRPGYAVIYDLHASFPDLPYGRYRLNVIANNATLGRFWTFASVTSNTTQLFTTVTPQRLQ